MNGVDFANKINRQDQIYRKNLADNNKAHEVEVERLKKTHEHNETKQKEVHGKSLSELEKSHIETVDRVKADQKKALIEKNQTYEETLNKHKKDFHEQKTDNIRTWDKKFSELKGAFDKNLADTKKADADVRKQLDKNYKENIENTRKKANKDLNAYIETRGKEKKESDIQYRIEKNAIIDKNSKEKNALIQREMDKRKFIEKNAVRDVQDQKELQTKRFIAGKNEQEKNFNKLTTDLNEKVQKQFIEREDQIIAKQTEANKQQNVKFSDRYDELSRQFNKDVRNLEYRKRAEDISQGEVNKEIQDKYKENMRTQIDLQRETQMKERFDVENQYSKRLRDTVESYQDTLRERNIASGEKIHKIEANLTEINRKDRFEDRQTRERMGHDHQVALKYVEDKNALKEADAKQSTNEKVRSLKENFNKSMEEARNQSQQNFEITKEAMLEDKRILEKRLHDQNSKQNAFIKEVYNEKLSKQSEGYEKRIQELELQNEMLQQNMNDSIRDVVRKTNFEIERQRKAAQESAKTAVKNERVLSQEKESSLNEKLRNQEAVFTQKMNDQSLQNRKKIKDVQFQLTQKLNSEANRYQDIIDQNNKFMAREFQRLKLASDTERQRLITQYEDRIQQLQRVYQEKTNEIEQFNNLNKA